MDQNPYQSPQTIALAAPRADDDARNTYDVLRGSKFLLIATLLGAGTMLAEFCIALMHVEQLWGWLSLLLTILGTLGGLLQVWGLWLMRRVPRASRAKRLVGFSLAAMILAIIVYWIALGLTLLWQDYRWILGGYILSTVISWLGHLARGWGFRRMGQYYDVRSLRILATCSFLLYFFYHGYALALMGWWLLNEPLELVYQQVAVPRNMLDAPLSAVLSLLNFTLGLLTLRAFKWVNLPRSEEQSLAT